MWTCFYFKIYVSAFLNVFFSFPLHKTEIFNFNLILGGNLNLNFLKTSYYTIYV